MPSPGLCHPATACYGRRRSASDRSDLTGSRRIADSSPNGRLIAIGDIHGCSAALDAVLGAIGPRPEDTIVTLGDYIDRGPDSRGVIERLLTLAGRTRLVPILGNHEEMMLQVLDGRAPAPWWLRHGGAATIESYGASGGLSGVRSRTPGPHVALLRGCRDWYEADDFFFTHGGYVEDRPLDNQPAEALRWRSLEEQFPGPHRSGKTGVVGHTAQHSGEVLDAGHLRCIDTACYAGGWLTAMEVRGGQLWQADRDGRLRGSEW